MKRFLTYSALFLAMMLGIIAVAEIVTRGYPNSYAYKKAWMDKNASRVRTLILGGSHTYYAVKPDMLGSNAFSLANVSQGPEYDYWLLSTYIDRCKNLKTVVMVADEANLFDPPMEDEPGEWYRCRYYRIYMDYPKHSKCSKYNLECSHVSTFSRKLVPALRYAFTGEYSIECDSVGFGNSFDTPAQFDSAFMERNATRVAEYHRCKDWTQVERNFSYVMKIARLCKEKGVRLILITPPMWKGFVEKVNPRQLEVMHNCIARIQKATGALYGNYLLDARFQGVDFYDADHLSKQGAAKFTAILKSDFPGF
ncbi:MAG: hypothetical protein ACI30R_00785 [Sodaliphilus sp.]